MSDEVRKVLPRVLPSILNYYNQVVSVKDVAGVQLYMSNDIFFNRYPNSSALKVHFLDASIIQEHLETAEKMECDGKSIRYKRWKNRPETYSRGSFYMSFRISYRTRG